MTRWLGVLLISITVLLTVIVLTGAAAVGGVLWFLLTGRWNIAAAEPHFGPVRWMLDQVYHASVDHHAPVLLPGAFEGVDLAVGAQTYAAQCARCHSTPGGEMPGWAAGMQPTPPHLPELGTSFGAAEIHWIVENGIKMTGMPSWRGVLEPGEITAVAALVNEFPGVSAEDYASLLKAGQEEAVRTAEAEANESPPGQGEAHDEAEEGHDQTSTSPAGAGDAERPEQTSGETAAGEESAGAGGEGSKLSEVSLAAAVEEDDTAGPAVEAAERDTGEQAAPAATVEMTNGLKFVPETVTVQAGETVRWTNPSDVPHTVTADPAEANDPSHVVLPEEAEPFNSGNIEPGGEWSHTFEVPGRYRYFCIPHEAAGMVGEIIVEG